MNPPDLVPFPECRRRLAINDNRSLKAICRRHGVRWLALNTRVLALRREDIETLLQRASTCAEAA